MIPQNIVNQLIQEASSLGISIGQYVQSQIPLLLKKYNSTIVMEIIRS